TSIDSINDFNSNDITCVGEPKPLFNRIDEAKMLEEIKLAKEQAVSDEKKEDKIEGIATIGIEDFSKVKLTVCKVLNCEEIKKSDKLLKFTLDDGSGVNRQVVSGIKKWYSPTDLIGKNLIVVTNLAPIKLRGEDSNGMILSAESFEGDKEIVTVLTVDENIKSGANIR
ncbi:MAG: methionine--tRNA ligase subunit beta, partial [Oscillospiraceae bacterium]